MNSYTYVTTSYSQFLSSLCYNIKYRMQIEDIQPSDQTSTLLPYIVRQLLDDKDNRKKVIRLLHQALCSMGFAETVAQLEKQSEIFPKEEMQFKIKVMLKSRNYQQLRGLLKQLQLQEPIKKGTQQILNELIILNLIELKNYENAIQKIVQYWATDSSKQNYYFTIIAMGQQIDQNQFTVREDSFLEKCVFQSYQLKQNIQKMLKGYIHSNDQQQISAHYPYSQVVSQSSNITGNVMLIKLSHKGDLVVVVSSISNQTIITLFYLTHPKVSKVCEQRRPFVGSICAMVWSKYDDKLCLCCQNKIEVYNAMNLKLMFQIASSKLGYRRILCSRWSNEDNLFVGGLGDKISILDNDGNMIRTIQPFAKIRQILFNSKNEIYAINATKGQLILFDIKQQKIKKIFKNQYPFMDIYLNQITNIIVASNQIKIFILNSITLQIISTLVAPENQKNYKIQVFLPNDWLVIYNQKMSAILQTNQVMKHHQCQPCQAVDVNSRMMVTATDRIHVWMSDSKTLPSEKLEEQKQEWFSQVFQQQGGQGDERMLSIPGSSSSSSQSQMQDESGQQDELSEQQDESDQQSGQDEQQSMVNYINLDNSDQNV